MKKYYAIIKLKSVVDMHQSVFGFYQANEGKRSNKLELEVGDNVAYHTQEEALEEISKLPSPNLYVILPVFLNVQDATQNEQKQPTKLETVDVVKVKEATFVRDHFVMLGLDEVAQDIEKISKVAGHSAKDVTQKALNSIETIKAYLLKTNKDEQH